MDGIDRPGGINNGKALRLGLCQCQKARTHALVERQSFLFHARALILARQSQDRVAVQQDSEMGVRPCVA